MYVGKTNDLRRRIAEHNRGKQTWTRRKSGTWILVYAEAYRDARDADLRERKLKQHGTISAGCLAESSIASLMAEFTAGSQ